MAAEVMAVRAGGLGVAAQRAGSQGVAARVAVGSGVAQSGAMAGTAGNMGEAVGMGAGVEALRVVGRLGGPAAAGTAAGLMAPAAGTVVRAGTYARTRTA